MIKRIDLDVLDGMQDRIERLQEKVDRLSIALDHEKFTCQNTFNHWQMEIEENSKLLEAGRGLVEALNKYTWQNNEYDDDIMTDGCVAREALATHGRIFEDAKVEGKT